MSYAIRLRDLTLGYDRHPAVHHLDAEIEAGSLVAICGPNGAGKSTLVKAIAGAIAPLAGTIAVPHTHPYEIAYLPQGAEIDRSFPIDVFDMVAMGLFRSCGLFGGMTRKHRDEIAAAIHAVGLDGFERRPISTLSGGQLQRMLFSRLLVQDASIILLDEPFTAIDTKTTTDLLDLVARWHDEARTILVVSHDLDLVRAHFPETILLAREQIAHGETEAVLTRENLAKARSMIEAFDRHAHACARDGAHGARLPLARPDGAQDALR
jgi:zinc/manganese transport system ATP-binding protein